MITEIIADYWADWLVDAIATATQDRTFLRGDPSCNEELCETILHNATKAITNAIKEAEKP